MKQRFLAHALAALAGGVGLAGPVLAAPTYGNIVDPPGVYFGSGNVNGNWTVDTANNIEVALRAKNRATLATIDGSTGVYRAEPGFCNPTCSGGLKAMWNYEFSVNVRADGTGTADLDDFLVRMEVDTDPSAGFAWTVLNVLSNWPDNAYWDGSAPRINRQSPIAGEFGAQQSANPMFGDSGYGYLPGAGLYGLRLSVLGLTSGAVLAQTSTTVAIPEPGTMALAGLAFLGLAAVRRRQKTG